MHVHGESERHHFQAGGEWLKKIGQQLRVEYEAVEPPMPGRLATLLEQLEQAGPEAPTCPRCQFTMVQVIHVQAFGGYPALGAYECPKCRYIDSRGRWGTH
jgi:hypothetical protein